MKAHPKLEIYSGSGEWSALYIDGKLDVVGDAYLAEEKAMLLCGVEFHQDSPDWIGPKGDKESVAQTTDEIQARKTDRLAREREAEDLEREANALLQQAQRLRRAGEA